MTEPVWSVNLMLAIGIAGVCWVIYKILTYD